MVPTAFVDPYCSRIDEFLATYGSQARHASIFGFNQLGLSMGDDPQSIRSDMAILQVALISIVSKHPWVKLLMTFRRLPGNLLRDENATPGSATESISAAPIINYATMFGTNLIVNCGQRSPQLFDRKTIFSAALTTSEIEAAVRVFVWSSLHAFMQYRINTKSREALSPGDRTAELIDSYNVRQRNRYEDAQRASERLDDMIVSPVSAQNLPGTIKETIVRSRAGVEYLINHRNYAPFPLHLDRLEPVYHHLDGPVFCKHYAMPYEKWLLIYRGLNACLFQSIATLWGPGLIKHVSEEGFVASVERADDLGVSALGIANIDSLAEWVANFARTGKRAPKIDADDVHRFIRTHTADPTQAFDPFVERPDCFYSLSEKLVIWDYIKSAALLPVIRRQMAPLLGATGKSQAKGYSFENLVKHEIKLNLQQVRAISGSKTRKIDGQRAFELDVGFVLDEVLFVIDAKHEVKSRRYMTGDSYKVQQRSLKSLEKIAYLDQQIKKHFSWLKTEWSGVEATHAIGIVCTAEVEYICTADRSAWLAPLTIPRACTIFELIEFLNYPDWKQIVLRNPATQYLNG